MKIVLIELFVPSSTSAPDGAQLVLRALAKAPRERNACAQEALAAADKDAPDADIVLFPGWTFVASDPSNLRLPARSRATVIFETIGETHIQAMTKTGGGKVTKTKSIKAG